MNHGLASFIGTCGRRETQAEREVLLSGGALEFAIGSSLTSTPRSEHPILFRRSTSRIPAKPQWAFSNCPITKEDGCVSGELSAFFFALCKGKKKLLSSD